MTRDDIRRMAREAEKTPRGIGYTDSWMFFDDGLERFAALVAAAEREECAKVCEEIKCGMWEGSKKHRDTRLRDASDGAGACTYAIRARGQS